MWGTESAGDIHSFYQQLLFKLRAHTSLNEVGCYGSKMHTCLHCTALTCMTVYLSAVNAPEQFLVKWVKIVEIVTTI